MNLWLNVTIEQVVVKVWSKASINLPRHEIWGSETYLKIVKNINTQIELVTIGVKVNLPSNINHAQIGINKTTRTFRKVDCRHLAI